MAKVDDPIVLDYQLHDYSTNKFVKAVIKADGVEMAISPVSVPHVGDGSHFLIDTNTLKFPASKSEVGITFQVFSDAAFTNRLKKYGASRDNYRLANPDVGAGVAIDSKLNQIINIVTSHDLNSQLAGSILDSEVPTGFVLVDELIGFIKDSTNVLTGFTEENISFIGDIFDDSSLVGIIE